MPFQQVEVSETGYFSMNVLYSQQRFSAVLAETEIEPNSKQKVSRERRSSVLGIQGRK